MDENNENFRAFEMIRFLKIAKFLRFIRLLKIVKLRQLMYKFEEFFFSEAVGTFMNLSKVMLITFFIGHLTGCTFAIIASNNINITH